MLRENNIKVQIIKVLVPKAGLFPLNYQISTKISLKTGDLISVPLRNKKITGIVWEIDVKAEEELLDRKKLKTIEPPEKEGYLHISLKDIEIIKKVSDYYIASLGSVAKLILPVDVGEKPIIALAPQDLVEHHHLPDLSQEQNESLQAIKNSTKPVLLKGVTGSGKTEVYFHLVQEIIRHGKQALILLPEISLGAQIIKRFTQRFGFAPAIWNSRITKAQKKRTLRGILNGNVKVIIGARSALFLPYKNLGVIVVDEEHDLSYKQNDNILYHARDMAILKGHMLSARVVLVSATPSIETLYNVRQHKYSMTVLAERFGEADLPCVKLIDMREMNMPINRWLSPPLIQAITRTISEGNQCLLFLNRRGFAPLMLCRSCGYRFQCYKCSASMVIHKARQKMECHHCGYQSKIYDRCTACLKDDSLVLCGPGIERIEQEAKELFPTARIKIISREQTSKEEELQGLLQSMEDGEIDILIGTQVITKGYHFPKLSLVGVIDADLGFLGGDPRSSERVFQLLHQISGRAGRTIANRGEALLQTCFPDNKVLKAIASNNEEEFIERELQMRKEADMPPFAKMAVINVTGKNAEKTLALCKMLNFKAPKASAKILGPAEALVFKVSNKYRYRLLVIANKSFHLQKYITYWLNNCKIPLSFQVKVDIDPYNFY